MKKLKTTVALAAAFTILTQSVSAEINLLTGEYSKGEWYVQGTFKRASGENAAITVLKPGKTVDDNDANSFAGEIPIDENGNFSGTFPIEDLSGEYVVRIGANGQIFEKSFLHVDITEINKILKEIADASSVSELTDVFEKDYGRLKALCNVKISPEDKNTVYKSIYDSVPEGGFDTFEELKKTVAEICIINSFMNGEPGETEELEMLFEYFDDEKIPAVSLWNNSELVDDELKKEVASKLQKLQISSIDELQEGFSEVLIVNALKDASSKGKELKIVKLTAEIIDASRYSDFSKLSETKQIGILSYIKSNEYNSVSEYAKKLDSAYETYNNESKNNTSSGGNKHGSVYVPSADNEDKPQLQKSRFNDLDNYSWAGASIESLFNRGIIKGKADGIFAPADNVKREEFTSMIIKALGLEDNAARFDSFSDVTKNDWYYSVVASAVEKEIIKGISDTEFGAGRVITRQDAVVICMRAAERLGISFGGKELESGAAPSYEYAGTEVNAFSDMSDVSEYAKDAVTAMAEAGIVKGKEDGSFAPANNMTRAEAAVVIDRLIKLVESIKADTDESDKNLLDTLVALDMIDKEVENLGEELIRGDAAELLCKLLSLQPSTPGEYIFDDIKDDNAKAPSIYTVYNKGYMLASDTSFMADYSLDYDEAVRAAVIALGFEKNAEIDGGYPNGYLKIAGEVGILKGVSKTASGKITKRDFLKMFYNMLDVNVLEMSMNNGEISYSESDEATFLSAYHDIYREKGKVVANERAGIGTEEPAGDNRIKIGNTELINSSEEFDAFIGQEVTYYYKTAEDEKELVYLMPSNRTKILTLDSDEIEDFKNMEYTYISKDGSKEENVQITKEVNVIYNTERLFDYTDSQLNPKVGSITFVDADGDEKYTNNDTVIITEYKNIVVSGVNVNNEVIYDKYSTEDNDYTLNLSEYEEYEIRDKHGDKYGLRLLREWDVLSVLLTPDKSYAKITLIDECRAGKVTSINSSEETVAVGGEEYSISKDFRGDKNELKLGKEVTVYWDLLGNVVAVEQGWSENALETPESSENALLTEKVVILTKCDINEENEKLFIKSYYSDKKFTYNELSEKVKINDKGYNTVKAAQTVKLLLEEQLGKAMIIRVNEAEEIAEIVTAAKPGEDETRGFYQLNYDGETLMYGTEAGNFGFRFKKGSSIYTIPENKASYGDSESFAYNNASFINDTNYIVDGYSTDPDSVVASTIVYKSKPTASGTYNQLTGFVVGNIETSLDEDDNPILCMTGIEYYDKVNYGTEASFEISADAFVVDVLGNKKTDIDIKDLGPGDCIRFGENNGVIETVQLMYDYSEDSPIDTNGTKAGQGVKGYAYSMSDDGNYLTICTEISPATLDRTSAESGGKYLKSYWIRTPSMVTVVDNTGKKPVVRKGTMADVLTYKAVGSGCSRVVLFTEWKATVYGMVVYIED